MGISGNPQFSISALNALWWGFGRWFNSTLILTSNLNIGLLALTSGTLRAPSSTSRVLLTGSVSHRKHRWTASTHLRSQQFRSSTGAVAFSQLPGVITIHPNYLFWSPHSSPKLNAYGLSGEIAPSYIPSRFISGNSISRLIKRWRRKKRYSPLPNSEALGSSTPVTQPKFLSYISKRLLNSDFLTNSALRLAGTADLSARLTSDRRYQVRRNRRLSRDERSWATPYLFLRFSSSRRSKSFRSRPLVKLFGGAIKSCQTSTPELFSADFAHLVQRVRGYSSLLPVRDGTLGPLLASSPLMSTRHYHQILKSRMSLTDSAPLPRLYSLLGSTSVSRPSVCVKDSSFERSRGYSSNSRVIPWSTLSSLSPSLLSVLKMAPLRRTPLLQSRFRRLNFSSRRRLRYVRYTISRYRRLAVRLKGTAFDTSYRTRFYRTYSNFLWQEALGSSQVASSWSSFLKTRPLLASYSSHPSPTPADLTLAGDISRFLTNSRYSDWSSYVFRRIPHVRRHRASQILTQKYAPGRFEKALYLTTWGKLRSNGLLRRDRQYVGYTSRNSLSSHFLSPSDVYSRLERYSFNVRRSYINRKLQPYLALRKSKMGLRTSTFAGYLRSSLSLGHENRFSYLSSFHPRFIKDGPLTTLLSGQGFHAASCLPLNLSDLLLETHRSFVPASSLTFSRNPFFASQLFTLISLLPDLARSESRKFFYFEPFDFVNYKQIKKTLFRRLVAQKYRADRHLGNRLHSRSRMEGHYADFRKPGSGSLLSSSPHSPLSSFFTTDHYRTNRSLFSHIHSQWRSSRPIGLPVIRKTRFKPGYPRMWRHERRVIKEVTGLTNRYQYRLTTKLQLLFFATRKETSFQNSMRLDYALILSHFAPDQFTSEKLLSNEYVYLNGSLTTNGLLHLFTNDFIQLIVSLRFYVLSKWIKGWSSLRFKKWMRRFYRTYRIKRQMFREFKFRSLPDSVMGLQNSWYDIPKSLEVDFFTLSSFVIVGNFRHFMQFPHHSNNLRVKILNMYNWKYIT